MDIFIEKIRRFSKKCLHRIQNVLSFDVYFGRNPGHVAPGAIVFFPVQENLLCCGLSGMVAVNGREAPPPDIDTAALSDLVSRVGNAGYDACHEEHHDFQTNYLAGSETIARLLDTVRSFKRVSQFIRLYAQPGLQETLGNICERLKKVLGAEEKIMGDRSGRLDADAVEIMSERIEDLKDAVWCLEAELVDNIAKIKALGGDCPLSENGAALCVYKEINAVLNSIDRLEVRGRDSAGISLLFVLGSSRYEDFIRALDTPENQGLSAEFNERSQHCVLTNRGITTNRSKDPDGGEQVAVALTYKVAAEIGSLGDNVRFLREQIAADALLQRLVACEHRYHSVSSHTRWASVGAINEANCHPMDNRVPSGQEVQGGIIHACLNGDIDNYLLLKADIERDGKTISEEISTDTKIIPLQIEKYLARGHEIREAFRLAVNDFEGSHAIAMHTDLAPGKLFLAQKGSGQAIFIGLAQDYYMPTSEVYGFVEETHRYLKLDGEKEVEGKNGMTKGQLFVLNHGNGGGLDGIAAQYYDGTPIALTDEDITETELTPRDIDRQGYPHFFLKEISESPASVERTLHNRWKVEAGDRYAITLDESVVPGSIRNALRGDKNSVPIRRVFFVGQGTAGIAAQACADTLNYYLNDPLLPITALKASELSGFKLGDGRMEDALVIAISQSGTTADTNRTVDMVKERGAHTLAIVNRRDSDITFKVDGVMYTSSGRDIEMSVASTKAFYSQIVAGVLLGLYIADLKGRVSREFLANEIQELVKLPDHMQKILSMSGRIELSARRLAPSKVYWAAVGSGPNKASADEIRIKLSELCYKTISSDYVEDKKHIDLSSEPLIIVCAAGTKSDVLGDIIKDTAIFKAHKATPVVIADEGEDRFDAYAEDVFHVPVAPQHLAPILNTLVGHVWGYYAALAINEGSRFLYGIRESLQHTIDRHAREGLDVFEVILEKSFRETVAQFYNEFRVKKSEKEFPTPIAMASDIILLLKYLSGRLPASDFELDFGEKGTARNMLDTLFIYMGKSINAMARPVDAIKHQAKTVTVGTSRISEKLEGILFDALSDHNVNLSQLVNMNIIVLKNLQAIIAEIKGAILYRISGLNLLGEPTDETAIEVVRKTGVLEPIPSRVEADKRLKGTKRIIVKQGNVYIGKGRKDDRSILVIPIISASADTPNLLEYLLLLNVDFKKDVPLAARVKALGGKHEHIKNIVQENSITWDDKYLELVEMDELFGRSAEKIGEYIAAQHTR